MYIKLTRFDNRPVWLNAAFVVTVEPRREGVGSIVVPIGDGLDYYVRESPEEVLRMLEGCPASQVVPVSVSDGLTKTPADVSPEPEREEDVVAMSVREDAEGAVMEEPAAAKTAKKVAKPRKPTATKKPKVAKKQALALSDAEVVRLGKLAPKSVAKLKNTLSTQFRDADVTETIAALEAKGVIKIDGNHVSWTIA